MRIFAVEFCLAVAVVRLHLQVIPPRKQIRVPLRRLTCFGVASFHEVRCHFAREARGRNDDAFAVLREQFAVDARLAVETFGVRQRRELDEVFVTDSKSRASSTRW